MAVIFLKDTFRGLRRWRLTFTGALGAGAFTSTSYYVVTTADFTASPPINVLAGYAVANDPNSVELAVDEDLISGAAYTVTITAVPVSGGTYTGAQTDTVPLPIQQPPNAEPENKDLDLLLYGRDLVWNGGDIGEDATGDLLTMVGRDNWTQAMTRRMISFGIPWDPTYGAQADQYVDAPDAYSVPLAGSLLAQARADDRTKQASVSIQQDTTDPNQWFFNLLIVGKDGLDPQSIQVPVPSNLTTAAGI